MMMHPAGVSSGMQEEIDWYARVRDSEYTRISDSSFISWQKYGDIPPLPDGEKQEQQGYEEEDRSQN